MWGIYGVNKGGYITVIRYGGDNIQKYRVGLSYMRYIRAYNKG
ncbi:hypothetical protein [Staphylococcus phage PT1-1]